MDSSDSLRNGSSGYFSSFVIQESDSPSSGACDASFQSSSNFDLTYGFNWAANSRGSWSALISSKTSAKSLSLAGAVIPDAKRVSGFPLFFVVSSFALS